LSLVPANVYREDRLHGHKTHIEKGKAGVTSQPHPQFVKRRLYIDNGIKPKRTRAVIACQDGVSCPVLMMENEKNRSQFT
jgi:hypothetical protein